MAGEEKVKGEGDGMQGAGLGEEVEFVFELGAEFGGEAGLVGDGVAGALGGEAELGAFVLEFEDFVFEGGEVMAALGEFVDGGGGGVDFVKGGGFLVFGEVVVDHFPGFQENGLGVLLAGAEDGEGGVGFAAGVAEVVEVWFEGVHGKEVF